MSTSLYMGIGTFSRHVGVSIDTLRAWERRYGIPHPARAANGHRLYSSADARLIDAMRRELSRGVPAAEAARRAVGARSEPVASASDGEPADRLGHAALGELDALAARLLDALDRFDETGAQNELDRLFGAYSVDTALAQVVLPYLNELGERWACGEVGIGHEHFAVNLIHGRLLSLARKWDEGQGPRALLACPAGELHTIGLVAFGLTLRMHGWRITYLGADTPIGTAAQVAATVVPDRVVLASVDVDLFVRARDAVADLAARFQVALGGAGARPELLGGLGAALLEGDPVTEATRVASTGVVVA
jgi:DNA-binding transcriptional MerR regulator